MFTRSWRDVTDLASTLLKGVGHFSDIMVQACDMTSNDMYIEYPWKDSMTTIANATLPLVDGVQDYSSPINIYRLIKASIYRRDTTPNDSRELDVVDHNSVDLVKRSYKAIRSVSQQQETGTLRLENAPNVPAGVVLELRGTYQLHPTKIVDLNQDMWFKDQYWQVAVEGVLYWGYKLSDDARSGTAVCDANGRVSSYTGQLGTFKAALYRMKMAEDYGAGASLFPEQTMGVGRDQRGIDIYGW